MTHLKKHQQLMTQVELQVSSNTQVVYAIHQRALEELPELQLNLRNLRFLETAFSWQRSPAARLHNFFCVLHQSAAPKF